MKRALVTGSTKGIGRAIGLELLSQGFAVAFNYASDTESARRLEEELDKLGYRDRSQIIQADLSRLEGIGQLLGAMDARFETLDYLVLNTATTRRGSLRDLTPEVWERVMRTNLTVPLFLTQACAPRMAEGGCVLFTGSAMGQYPHAMSIPYGTSKAAVHHLSRSLVKELAPQGVRVNCLCPGFVDTPWQKDKPREIRQSIESKIALHRFAAPEEVARMAASILTNTYMNGAIVNIDGGYCYQ